MPTVEMAGLSGNLLMQQDLQPYSDAGLAPGFSNFRAKALSTEEILYGAALCMRGQNNLGRRSEQIERMDQLEELSVGIRADPWLLRFDRIPDPTLTII
jgi:hypothetical protein